MIREMAVAIKSPTAMPRGADSELFVVGDGSVGDHLPKRTEPASSRHQAERGIGQQFLKIISEIVSETFQLTRQIPVTMIVLTK